jgi:hypothetical protein
MIPKEELMRKLAIWILALGMAASPAVFAADGLGKDKGAEDAAKKTAADTSKTDTTKTDSVKKDATTTPAPTNAEVVAEMEQLRALLKQQADQLEEQRRELAEMKAGLAHSATASATTVGDASGTTTTTMAAATPAANPAPAPQDNDAPLQLRIGSATITPVGFLDFTTVYRSHDGGSGIGTNFAGIPYGNVFQNNQSEFRFSMQNSRIGFRVDADVKGAHIIGYMEADFLGNNPGNVAVSSNSNTLRSRVFWVDVRKDQWEFLGGQTWSLITPGRKGISPLPGDLFYTQNIDVNYQLGLVWGRIPEARFVYHPSDKVALAFALDSPEQYTGGSAGGPSITCPAGAAFATICGTEFNSGGNTLGVPNEAPDIIVKLAFDPISRFHGEVGGVERQLHDFNSATTTKFSATAGGAFINLNAEVFKGFRLITNNFWSDGGGRYIFGQAPDAIIRANGKITPIHSGSTVSGVEFTHGNTLLYGYYGALYVQKVLSFDANGTSLIGYGLPNTPSQNRAVQEGTAGFAQTFWKSPKYGALIFMGQYSYVARNPWSFANGQPEDAHLNMFFLNLRYALPGSAPSPSKK